MKKSFTKSSDADLYQNNSWPRLLSFRSQNKSTSLTIKCLKHEKKTIPFEFIYFKIFHQILQFNRVIVTGPINRRSYLFFTFRTFFFQEMTDIFGSKINKFIAEGMHFKMFFWGKRCYPFLFFEMLRGCFEK